MKRKFLRDLLASSAACFCILTPMTADAATPQEVADAARSCGFTEDLVQQLLNLCAEEPDKYTPEVLDEIMANLDDLRDMIITNVPYVPTEPTVTTPVPEQPQPPDVPDITDDTITLTMPGGSVFTRISREDFIAMSYDEKQAYLATFTPEQQTVFLADLTPEEYRSMLRQLPDDVKTDIIDDMSKITDSFDLSLSVEDMSDDNFVFSLKNDSGELVAVNSAKNTVDNTGYDRRGILGLAAFLVTAGIAGMLLAAKNSFKKEKTDE